MYRKKYEYTEHDREWQNLKTKILKRDDYTCQRCGHRSGPHADGDGRILQVHHKHKRSEGGSDDPKNLTTLCRPCHGVQHPDNEEFHESRKKARLFPAGPDDGVAYVNSKIEGETITDLLERKKKDNSGLWMSVFSRLFNPVCNRCGNPVSEDNGLLYPAYEDDDIQYPAEKCRIACYSCANIISNEYDHGFRTVVLFDEITTRAGRITDPESKDSARRKGSLNELSAERDPVNRNEEIIDNGLYNVADTFGAPVLTGATVYLLWDSIHSAAGSLAPMISTGIDILETYVSLGLVLVTVATTVAALFYGGWKLTSVIWNASEETVSPNHWQKRGYTQNWLRFTHSCAVLYFLPIILTLSFIYNDLKNDWETWKSDDEKLKIRKDLEAWMNLR